MGKMVKQMEGYQDFNRSEKEIYHYLTCYYSKKKSKLFHISCTQQCIYFNHTTPQKAWLLV